MKIRIIANISSFLQLSHHLKPLAGLWSASALVSAGNFIAIFTIVAYSPVEVYAAYSIGQAILALSSAWSDGGLANTMQVMAAQHGNQRGALELYKKAGMKFSLRIVPFAYAAILIMAGVLMKFSKLLEGVDFYVLAGFGLVGVLNSRANFSTALLYAIGNFKSYSISRAVAASARPFLVVAAVIGINTLQLNVLVAIEVLASLFGWAVACYYGRMAITRMTSSPVIECQEEVNVKIKQFLKPSFFAVIFRSLGHNLNVFGASLFAMNISIAAFGVFQRLNQIFGMVAGPLISYGARKLRLIPKTTDRRRKEILSIYGILFIYGGYSIVCILVYNIAGAYSRHYSLDYPLEFFIFLAVNGVGYLIVALNSILLARGNARHLVPGTLMQLVSISILIAVICPDNLFEIVSLQGASLLPTVFYYGYLFAKNQGSSDIAGRSNIRK